jgi:hypothetical protein
MVVSIPLKHALFWLGMAMLPIAPFALIGGAIYVLYAVNACITEVRQDGIFRANMQFRITETNCSTMGEDASVSVYGSSASSDGKTLLFKYGPASYDLPLPTIEVPDQQTIIITVPIVSDVAFQLHTWNDRSIKYDIGQVNYPRTDNEFAR